MKYPAGLPRMFEPVKRQPEETDQGRDLEFARRIQQNILPDLLEETRGFSLVAHHLPLDTIGGDFYDLLQPGDNRFGILAADTGCHGVSAALCTMLLKSLEASLAHHANDPAAFVSGLNDELFHYCVTDDSCATGVYAVLDTEAWTLHYCTAGHPPLILYRAATGTVEMLATAGMPLGVFEGGPYRAEKEVLKPGDLVLFYTDGLTEARAGGDQLIGGDGLAELLRQEAIDCSADLPKRLYDRVLALSGDLILEDDALLLALRRW